MRAMFLPLLLAFVQWLFTVELLPVTGVPQWSTGFLKTRLIRTGPINPVFRNTPTDGRCLQF
jgi:hypothetical protein